MGGGLLCTSTSCRFFQSNIRASQLYPFAILIHMVHPEVKCLYGIR
jgi:hypothetical protein